jgi:rubrerythrin
MNLRSTEERFAHETPQEIQRASLASNDESRVLELKGTITHANLVSAFARSSQLCRLFKLYGRIAEIEGYAEVAASFHDLIQAEEFLAAGHLDFIRRVGDPLTGMNIGETLLNLSSAISSELQDSSEDVDEMARTAHAEGFPDVASWFETLAKTKEQHGIRFKEVLHHARTHDDKHTSK